MRFRKLRIAWSVGWGVAAVLLIVLCLRNYSGGTVYDSVWFGKQRVTINSFGASLSIGWITENDTPGNPALIAEIADPELALQVRELIFQHRRAFGTNRLSISCPYWMLTSAAILVARAPWLPWRFSLRTLLIATTLLAVVLGLTVWAARK
jgi:hypothetical protein